MNALSHLNRVLHKKRAPTQRAVLRSLLHGKTTGKEIARDLSLSENAVNIALHELYKHGAIEKVRRGVYKPRERLLCLALMERVERLERRRRR